jgi:hypothetical protein
LRLDLRAEMLADRGGYAVVVPGDVEQSEMLARVLDDIDPMPPTGEAEPLDEEERDVLRRWIEQGAPWSEHWAFAPPVRSASPPVADEDWVRDRGVPRGVAAPRHLRPHRTAPGAGGARRIPRG